MTLRLENVGKTEGEEAHLVDIISWRHVHAPRRGGGKIRIVNEY
ncbi:MAG: hypothetical protein ACE5LF_00995 [Alphaproteobacteria bacterium]